MNESDGRQRDGVSSARPDIVIILTDQLRFDCLGATGSTLVQTPQLDRLASEGVRFTHAFTPSGLCGPARASIATGRYPHAHGVLNNVTGPDAIATDLRSDAPPLVRCLADAGYATGYVGKYHLARHESPMLHGFSEQAGTNWRFDDADFAQWRKHKGFPVDDYPIFPVERWMHIGRDEVRGPPLFGRELVPLEATPPWYLVEQALSMLDRLRADDHPIFLVLSFLGPHWPHLVPEPYWSMYDPDAIEPWPSFHDTFEGKPGMAAKQTAQLGTATWTWDDWRQVVATYFASVSFHDELIGRFLAALDDRGLGDALVMMTTDHGDMTGAHRIFNKGPFMYDDVYRIPFIARWPGVITAGSVSDRFVSNLDLMPTAVRAAGLPLPDGVHGYDLGPLLNGRNQTEWRDAFFGQYHGDEYGLHSQRMLRTERYKFVFNTYDLDELYDLEEDPYEMRNLAGDNAYAEVALMLASKLRAWMTATGDPLAATLASYA